MGIAHHPDQQPVIPAESTPHPEASALAVIAAYRRRYDLSITAGGGMWTVTGGELEEPKQIALYTDLVSWLAQTFGRI